MFNSTDRLGFRAWFGSVFGTNTAARRETYELCRWAWKELEGMGEEPMCALVWIILNITPADRILRGMQILAEGYAPYEEDLRRHTWQLANQGAAAGECSGVADDGGLRNFLCEIRTLCFATTLPCFSLPETVEPPVFRPDYHAGRGDRR